MANSNQADAAIIAAQTNQGGALPAQGLELRSLVTEDGVLRLSLEEVAITPPGPGEVLVRIEASPINPSDLGLLLAAADPASAVASGSAERPVLEAKVPQAYLPSMHARLGQSLAVGNEGAGRVIAAGPGAEALLGNLVGMAGGAMYAQYRRIEASACMVLHDGVSAEQGASCFVNPLTALAMIETMKSEGHTALVHTAAASNLGQMLCRICHEDGIGLVNIVRSEAQAELLRGIGATHVLNSRDADFIARLTDAIDATGATLGFDAIGGGRLAGDILGAMEVAQNRKMGSYSRYGSFTHKQVYIYGALDFAPTTLGRNYGMAWGVGGWLLTPRLMRFGTALVEAMRARVVNNLTTLFASHYTARLSLQEALLPENMAAYNRRATGEKFLILPHGR